MSSSTFSRGPRSPAPAPIPFPGLSKASKSSAQGASEALALANDLANSTNDDVIDALATVSRRINDLARELKCLGYFDDENNDRPRAA
jgi:hypothetical protein